MFRGKKRATREGFSEENGQFFSVRHGAPTPGGIYDSYFHPATHVAGANRLSASPRSEDHLYHLPRQFPPAFRTHAVGRLRQLPTCRSPPPEPRLLARRWCGNRVRRNLRFLPLSQNFCHPTMKTSLTRISQSFVGFGQPLMSHHAQILVCQ